MDAKRFVAGTVAGGVTLFVTGYLIFTLGFAAFYAANSGSAVGVDRPDQIYWAVVVSALAYAALIMVALGSTTGISMAKGAKVGALVGFLIWATADFVIFGTSNVANLTRTVVDPLLEIVHGGLGGAAIALVLNGMTSR